MSSLHILKKSSLIMALGLMIFATGCGKRSDTISDVLETSRDEMETTTKDTVDHYVKQGVVLPANFNNMVYVLEALSVSDYVQGYRYYTKGEDEEAFWFPMAVLSSLISEQESEETNFEDGYYYYSRDKISSFASSLFEEYALDKIKIPEVEEGSQLVIFGEDSNKIGLLSGNIGDLSIEITACDSEEDAYLIKADLMNVEDDIRLASYQFKIRSLKDNDLFAYSVAECKNAEEEAAGSSDSTAASKPNGQTDFDEVDGVEITDDSTESDSQEYGEDPKEAIMSEDVQEISRTQALELAKVYMGEDAKYTYKQMVSIGEYEYFDFSVRGENNRSTDVLVCTDGNDVVGAIQNEDGSWTFDQ